MSKVEPARSPLNQSLTSQSFHRIEISSDARLEIHQLAKEFAAMTTPPTRDDTRIVISVGGHELISFSRQNNTIRTLKQDCVEEFATAG